MNHLIFLLVTLSLVLGGCGVNASILDDFEADTVGESPNPSPSSDPVGEAIVSDLLDRPKLLFVDGETPCRSTATRVACAT